MEVQVLVLFYYLCPHDLSEAREARDTPFTILFIHNFKKNEGMLKYDHKIEYILREKRKPSI